MADAPVVHIGENSPEEVAFKLLKSVAYAEDKYQGDLFKNADRKWILDTYEECLRAVLLRR